jgi:hypothetical protein
VVAIVIGAVIGLAVVNEIFGARLLEAQRQYFKGLSQPGPGIVQRVDLQTEIAAAMARQRPFFMAVAPLGLLGAAGMIVGGIGCLSLRRRARPLLVAAFSLGCAYEIAVAKPTLDRQVEVMAMTTASMRSIMDVASAPVGPSASERSAPISAPAGTARQVMGTALNVISTASVASTLLWSALKIGFMLAGVAYLSQARIRRLFAPAPSN